MSEQKEGWGGARTGAGREPEDGHKAMESRVTIWLNSAERKHCEKHSGSISDFVRSLITSDMDTDREVKEDK